MKVHKMTLREVGKRELFRISIPKKMKEWENIEQGQKLLLTLDIAPRGKYAKLYNMSERGEKEFVNLH